MNIHRTNTWLWSAGLMVGGLVLLLFNLNGLARFEPLAQYILGGLTFAGGLGFFAGFIAAPTHWWRLIPGWTLLALALMIVATTLPAVGPQLTAALLFVGLAAAFAHIYLLRRHDNWWAIIPSGFMLVLAAVIVLSSTIARVETLGAILFSGLGAVFLALYLVTGRNTQWWALIPAAALLIFGLFIFTLSDALGGERNDLLRWWPVLLIALGIAVGWWAARTPPARRDIEINRAPALRAPAAEEPPEKSPRSPLARWRRARQPASTAHERLGDYSRPAPGSSVQVFSDPDDGAA